MPIGFNASEREVKKVSRSAKRSKFKAGLIVIGPIVIPATISAVAEFYRFLDLRAKYLLTKAELDKL